jgi:hypothetical protein
MLKIPKSNRGAACIDVVIVAVAAMLVIALAVNVVPVFIVKHQLDTYAAELCRTAEIAGCIGSETAQRAEKLTEQTRLTPSITWTADYIPCTDRVQLNGDISVTLKQSVDIGLWGGFGSFPVGLTAKATGRSEVYWK